MTYGYNPVLPAYAVEGQTLAQLARLARLAGQRRHRRLDGARARASCACPPGRFKAIAVRSTLRQTGHPLRQRHAHELLRARPSGS